MELVADCPRCGAMKMTCDVPAVNRTTTVRWGWQHAFEVFGICRNCGRSAVYVIEQREAGDDSRAISYRLSQGKPPNLDGSALTTYFSVLGPITLKDNTGAAPPEHVPDDIATAFREGATCCVVGCWNAAGSMFRLCIDLATKAKLPPDGQAEIKPFQRHKLAPRLAWMFDNDLLPDDVRGLSDCIREDGNDGAHDGSLAEADALDLQEFCTELLRRLYTEPARLAIALARRKNRREGPRIE